MQLKTLPSSPQDACTTVRTPALEGTRMGRCKEGITLANVLLTAAYIPVSFAWCGSDNRTSQARPQRCHKGVQRKNRQQQDLTRLYYNIYLINIRIAM